ncbi:hypothetical protein [Actinomadura bangladeshensis]|uniref:PE domain-containing protein n=1 Tax=Actinomadura bangladeshensis TaxID=453573 RepID=A0A4R4P756_9ACTN|nr:hypothetical protein [Actinomadura bangladeshensis]TDC16693.1 hypothetical protein E1284_11640 [Actinomadura bangladeshensis]
MTTGFEVSPDRIKAAASQLRAAADDLADAAKSFQAEVSGFGEPWGGDDIGMVIGLAHGAIFQAAVECFTDNAKELSGHAEGLTRVADNHVRTEEANVLYVNRVREFL